MTADKSINASGFEADKPVNFDISKSEAHKSIEKGVAKEKKAKPVIERGTLPKEAPLSKIVSAVFKKKKVVQIPAVKDELSQKIEIVMEEGLKDVYLEMPESKRIEFKVKGEQTALAIRDLMTKTKISIKKIFQLIFEWLKIIPGVNKFFLEKEALIKAEKIIGFKKEE